MMMAVVAGLDTLWGAAGVLVGFQVAAFTLRINREIAVSGSGGRTWFPVADCINMLSLSTTLLGVFLLPTLDLVSVHAAQRLFGVSVLLLIGYAVALVGHYEMFNPKTARSYVYFPRQEQIAVAFVAVAVVIYIVLALVQ
jgi:hypothetical protein